QIAQLCIDTGNLLNIGRVHQIELIEADHRTDVILLGGQQIAIDQRRFESRLGTAGHDQQVIDIGDNHMLAPAAGAAEHAVTRLDALDHSAVVTVGKKADAVTGSHNVPLIGGQRLKQLPYGAGIDLSVIAQHPAAQTV